MHHIAVTAAIVLLALALQKPSQGSKAKDHQECLSMRLALWKEGEIDTLLREGRIEDIPHVIYHQINGEIIKEVALETKGSGSPSGIDLNGF